MGLCMISPRRMFSLYLAAAAASVMVLSAAPSQAYSINDFASGAGSSESYWGATTHGYQDVISGNPTDTSSLFEIKGSTPSRGAGKDLDHQIYTNYNPKYSEPSHPTTYGDLFLTPSTSYNPFRHSGPLYFR